LLAQKSFLSLVTAGFFWRTTLQHFWHLFHGVFTAIFSMTTTGCTKIFVQPVILTSLFFHVLFFLPTAPRTMMANDAQEETSCDAKRRVQQFIKGTIEMQNDDRFKGLMELMLPGAQQIWNALYDLPTNTQVTYEDTLSRVIYDSANHHYSNTIPHDRCPLLLFVSGVTSISDTFGVCEAHEKKLHSIFHPIIYAAMTGCSKSQCKARLPSLSRPIVIHRKQR
jgi:hypothetical protein